MYPVAVQKAFSNNFLDCLIQLLQRTFYVKNASNAIASCEMSSIEDEL